MLNSIMMDSLVTTPESVTKFPITSLPKQERKKKIQTVLIRTENKEGLWSPE